MPQACTRTRTCPALGFGISRSTISKSAPGFCTSATFIFAISILHSPFAVYIQSLDAFHAQTATFLSAAEKQGKKEALHLPQSCRFVTITTVTVCLGRVISCDTKELDHLSSSRLGISTYSQSSTADLRVGVLYGGGLAFVQVLVLSRPFTFNNAPHFILRYL